jgi:hypothetical protein
MEALLVIPEQLAFDGLEFLGHVQVAVTRPELVAAERGGVGGYFPGESGEGFMGAPFILGRNDFSEIYEIPFPVRFSYS